MTGDYPPCDDARRDDSSDAASANVETFKDATIALARETIAVIQGEVELLGAGNKDAPKGDARLKALLGLTKALQSMEDLIIRMEHAVDEHGARSLDPLELLERLSRKIENVTCAESPDAMGSQS